MRRSILLMICMWCVIAVVIVAVIVSGLTFYTAHGAVSETAFNNSHSDGTYLDEQYGMEEIGSLRLHVSAGSVNVYHADDGMLRVAQYGKNIPERQLIEVKISGSTIRIEPKGGIQIFSFNLNMENHVDIYIPADYSGDLQAKVSAGNLDFNDDFTLGSLDLDVSAGSLEAGANLTAKKADIGISAGGLTLYELTADSFSVTSSAGSVLIGRLSGSGKVSSSAGKIRINSVDITNNLDIRSSAGSIDIALEGDPGLKYSISASAGSIRAYFDSSTGAKKVSGTYGDGPYKKLDASSSAGSITITQA